MNRLGFVVSGASMRLLGRYRFLITGDTTKIGQTADKAIDYLFSRLVRGEAAAMHDLNCHGIEVRQLGDRDEIITVPAPSEQSD